MNCKTCKYRSNQMSINLCDYCYITGHSRGCDPEDCIRYKKGARLGAPNEANLYRRKQKEKAKHESTKL